MTTVCQTPANDNGSRTLQYGSGSNPYYTQYGLRVDNTNSIFHEDECSTLTFYCTYNGSGTGDLYAKVYDNSDVLIATSNAVDVTSIPTSGFNATEFTFNATYDVGVNYKLVLDCSAISSPQQIVTVTAGVTQPSGEFPNNTYVGWNADPNGGWVDFNNHDMKLCMLYDTPIPSSGGTHLPPPPIILENF